MKNILIIQKSQQEIGPLHEGLRHFDDINIVITHDKEEALALLSDQYFELLFFDLDYDSIEVVKILKEYNPETILIAFNSDLSPAQREKALALGARDCIRKTIDNELIRMRLANYFELVTHKKQSLFHTDAINLFDKSVFSRMVTFKLDSYTAIVEFWDYFRDEQFKEYENIDASIATLYAFALWLSRNDLECKIVKETNPSSLYLTICPMDFISEQVVKNILLKHDKGVAYLRDENRLSLKLDRLDPESSKDVSAGVLEIDDTKRKILGKMHLDKISAAEFVETTAISFMSKVDSLADIEDRISDALITFENGPSTEKTHLIANAFSSYVEVTRLLVEFGHLVFAIETLADVIVGVTQEQLTPKEVTKFTTLMLHLVTDLATWRENIFIKQEANDIHYLDASLLSSCLQIETIFVGKSIEEEDDDFELF